MSKVEVICFYGPESTGKTTMAKRFADIYTTKFVPEVAREFITTNNFTVADIIKIGKAQFAGIQESLPLAHKYLFCDTDLITTQIYSKHYLNVVPPVLFELEKMLKIDKYFLFDIDVPWIADGLRDLGDFRQEMFNIFKKELQIRNIESTHVRGTYAEREETIRRELEKS